MRRFEGGSKFWEIRLDGTTVYTRWGKIGTDGKANAPKKLATLEKARADVAKRVAEQLAKGMTEVTEVFAPEPSNPALEKQIIEEPTDSGRCLVYADWLQGQGHPRGELGVLQSQRAERPDDTALAKAEQKLFEKHPELAPARITAAVKAGKRKTSEPDEDRCSVTWENGFIVAARIARSEKLPYTVRELVGEVLAHPAARFLRELRIGGLGEDVHAYGDVIEEIIRRCPSTLRVLSLVDLPPGSAQLVFANLADVTALLAATPLLEELRLAGNHVQLRAIELPKLRRLAVATNDPSVLAALAASTLPALESLELSSGDSPMPAAPLAKVLAASWPVRRLAITRTANTDELVPHIAKSLMLEQLARLDLSGGKLTDDGAAVLHAAKAQLAHVAELDVANNTLTAKGTKLLASVCANVNATPQRAIANATISEDDLRRMSPDASALAKGREVAKPKLWPTLGRDDDMYWGTCRGSDTYEVYVRVPSLANGCTCPSGKRPCKHTIGLAILIASGHAFDERRPPSGLTSRASSGPYYSSYE